MGPQSTLAHIPIVTRRSIGRTCWFDISRDSKYRSGNWCAAKFVLIMMLLAVSKKAIKCFKLYQVTTSMTILVHPLHRLNLYRHGRAKGHLAGYHQALPILAEEYYAMIQYQECSQSQIMSEPKIHITTPLGLNTTRLYRPQTSIGRLNRLDYSRYSREWKHPFRTYLRQTPGAVLLRRRPPQATQQLQYLVRRYGQVQ